MNPRRNRQRGKAAERAVAKMMNGKRVGLFGKEDVEHPVYSIEVKSRVSFVARNWINQAVRNDPTGKTPIVVVHVKNHAHENDLVIMRIQDFKLIMEKEK